MAIDCGIETQYGAEFSYHKIVDVHIIVKDQVQLRITVDSWMNKQCRIDGKKPVRTVNIIDNMDFALTPFYQVLKMKFPQYSDGEDDYDDSWKGEIEKKNCAYSVQCENSLIASWQDNPPAEEVTEQPAEEAEEEQTGIIITEE